MPAVGTRDAQWPARLALVAGIANVVVGLVDLAGALERVARRAEVSSEAADVHLPHVHRRLPCGDPLRHHPPDPTGAGEPVRAEPGRHVEAPHLALPEAELVVGRERLGTVDEPGHGD